MDLLTLFGLIAGMYSLYTFIATAVASGISLNANNDFGLTNVFVATVSGATSLYFLIPAITTLAK